MEQGQSFNLYRDIAERTEGDVYIGVVGPVRTGKSTFIARFMEELVLPTLPSGPRRDRIIDELPQSASGRTIMTTQPKFVPNEAVEILLPEQTTVRIRMVDSVGYLVPGALGNAEGEEARMVRTPWSEQDMPFEQAAETGTRRVMTDHATIGMVITTDGTITELNRNAYVEAEERVVRELKALGKPFVVVLNSAQPRAVEALALRDALEDRYDVPVMLMNVKEMGVEDIQHVLESILLEFPLREAHVNVPAWLGALEEDHWLVRHVLEGVLAAGKTPKRMSEAAVLAEAFTDSAYTEELRQTQVSPGEGRADFTLPMKEGLFNQILGEQCGTEILGDAHLLSLMKELVAAKAAYDRIAEALEAAKTTGYGMVRPSMKDVELDEPESVRQGSQFGVRLRAHAPSLHLIATEVETEVLPVVGNEEQTEDFVRSLRDAYENEPERLWETSFFGKSLSDLVQEGMTGKLSQVPEDAREKVQETLTRMVNEGEGGMVCILL